MNVTTIASQIGNITPTTMPNSDTAPEGDDTTLGAYTTVLAVTAHIVAMLFGGGKCLAVLAALLTRPNINKYSYLLVLTLLVACCSVNFIYSPLEISDLLTYHYHQRHPCDDYLTVKIATYIFFMSLIGIAIVLITIEAIFRPSNCFGHIVKKVWPLTACLFAVVWSVILMILILMKMLHSSPSYLSSNSNTNAVDYSSYVIPEGSSHLKFELITIIMIILVFLVLIVLLIQLLKSCIYWEGGHPHFRKKKMSLAMPEFLISQSQNDCDEEYTGGYDNVNEPSTSRSPSPSTPKLLMVSSPDSASIKGGEGMALTQTTPKSSGNRLGINMAQVLGRRRHTICQISDSTSTPAPPDPICKAKQYNYVRKFSVDISALQAQLQNPKIFKEAPFQSDMDLAKRAGEGDKNNRSPKPLQPLQPLNLKLDDKKSKSSPPENDTTKGAVTTEAKVETPQSAGLSIPPPVIMVSNDDTIPEKDDASSNNDEKENVPSDKTIDNAPCAITLSETNNKTNSNHDVTNGNNTNSTTTRPEIPTSLSLKGEPNNPVMKFDNNTKNDVIVTSSIPPGLESSPIGLSVGSAHENTTTTELQGVCGEEDSGNKLARLSAGLCVTFIVCMLPVQIVHSMRLSMSVNTFVSITTCTMAISTALQTIVYPHLIACCDGVVRRAVRKMKARVKRYCLVYICRRDDGNDDDDDYTSGPHRSHNIDDTSSTSHV